MKAKLIALTTVITIVFITGCNQPPVIDSITASDSEIAEGETVTLSVTASDVNDSDVLTYSYEIESGNGSLGGDDTASGKTYTGAVSDTNMSETATIKVTVSDGSEDVVFTNVSITVISCVVGEWSGSWGETWKITETGFNAPSADVGFGDWSHSGTIEEKDGANNRFIIKITNHNADSSQIGKYTSVFWTNWDASAGTIKMAEAYPQADSLDAAKSQTASTHVFSYSSFSNTNR